MRPITHSVAKPLIPIAGKPILQHIIDPVLATPNIKATEIIFITGHLKEQIEEWVKEHYDIPLRFIEQKVQNGTADAIRLVEPYIKNEDMLIIFSDTMYDVDFEVIAEDKEAEGIIWCAEVDDPRRFGVVVHDEDRWMTEMVEKPDKPPTNLVNIGIYYIKDTKSVFSMIGILYENDVKTKGEYSFTDALDLMAKNGKKVRVVAAEGWHDTGVYETTLATNKEFCKRAGIKNSISSHATIEKSTLSNCIVMDGARVQGCDLKESIIGPRAVVKNFKGSLIVGSDAQINGS